MPRPALPSPVHGALLVVAAFLCLAAPASAARFTSIAPGLNHTCAVKADATAWCWGEGRQGQVGRIGTVRSRVPLLVIGSYQTTQISSGQAFWCQRLADSTSACSGRGDRGQIGNGAAATAQYPLEGPLTGVTKVAAGSATACAIHDGLVSCWGDNLRGQIGNGKLVEEPNPVPSGVPGIEGAIDIAVGDTHACAVRADGNVLCWGDTSDGKLGDNSVAAITIARNPVIGLSRAKAIAVGDRHSCALKSDGFVFCWGDDSAGQLGNGAGGSSPTAVQVPGISNVVQIAAAGMTTCAVRADGTAFCWGDNTGGQLGNGSRTNAASPTPIGGITDAAQIGVGSRHSCLVTKTQTPYCWGTNASGQLGTGAPLSTVSLTPQVVEDFALGPATFLPASIAEVSAGSRAGGVIQLNALKLTKRKGRACPTRGSLRITARGRTSNQRISISKVPGGCAASGRYELPGRSENATKAVIRITGSGFATVNRSLKARRK